jgi:peptide/nickel transport system substrate-binding protein
MVKITRRAALAGLAAPFIMPRFALADTDTRPSIVIAVQKTANSNTLDVLREQSNVGERIFFSSLWEGLIGRDWLNGLGKVPLLATEWRRIDDTTVELDLRKGVKFHNGDEMTAEDVAFSFGPDRMFGDTKPSANPKTLPYSERIPGIGTKEVPPEVFGVARRSWPNLIKVEIVDKYKVRFINGSPDVTIEGRISRFGSEIMNRRAFVEAAKYIDWARKPITTGPYMVADYKPDQSLTYVAHDEYWGGRPPIKQIKFVEVPEVSARVNGLFAGDFHFACDIPPDQISLIEKNPAFEVQGGTILNHRLTVFDKNYPVLADARVRRAMTHAIDRQSIVDALWAGRTSVPKGLQWSYYDDMYISDWSVPAYDPKTAQNLLKEAGYKGDKIPYRLLNNYYTNQVQTAQALVEMWKAIGLNVEIQMVENWSQIMEKTPTRGVRDWSNSAPFNDPVSSIVNQHGPNGQQQQIGEWTNEEFNGLSNALETSTDRAKRKEIFRRMLTIAEREDPAYTVLHQNATFTAKPKSIKWKTAPAFAMDFRKGNFSL